MGILTTAPSCSGSLLLFALPESNLPVGNTSQDLRRLLSGTETSPPHLVQAQLKKRSPFVVTAIFGSLCADRSRMVRPNFISLMREKNGNHCPLFFCGANLI